MAGEINRRLQQIKDQTRDTKIAREAFDVFKRNTPMASGNARRNTRLVNNEIRADYPYAGRLDQGYSDKSPNGMTEPTLEAIKKYIKRI